MDAKPHPTAEGLLAICQGARKAGADFPTLWREKLKHHPLVDGMPVQVILGEKPALSIQLLDGRCLTFGEDGFRLG